MKKVLLIIGGIIVLIIIIAIASGGGEQQGPEKVGETPTTGAKTEQPKQQETKVYNLGDQVKLEDKIVTAYSITDYTEPDQFLQAKVGNKYVNVDVSIESAGTEAINVNVFGFALQDSDSYSYTKATTSKEPYYPTVVTVQPGRKVRGFISYEVPSNASGFELVYTPSGWSSGQVIIDLGK